MNNPKLEINTKILPMTADLVRGMGGVRLKKKFSSIFKNSFIFDLFRFFFHYLIFFFFSFLFFSFLFFSFLFFSFLDSQAAKAPKTEQEWPSHGNGKKCWLELWLERRRRASNFELFKMGLISIYIYIYIYIYLYIYIYIDIDIDIFIDIFICIFIVHNIVEWEMARNVGLNYGLKDEGELQISNCLRWV